MIGTWLSTLNLPGPLAHWLGEALLALVLLIVCVAVNWIAKRVIVGILHKIAHRTKATWDDILVARGVYMRLSHLAPGLLLFYGAALFANDAFGMWVQRVALAYVGLCVAASLHALLNALQDIYRSLQSTLAKPITGYVQTAQLLMWLGAVIYAVATLMGRSPAAFLAGLGALSAILMLVFRDTIMGLVAGVQLTANDMVRLGDWIEMPKFGADGDVIDITLHTVKIRNFDQTITTIPAHALIADSFKNWRGMQEAGGRRIKRALLIDLHSVGFCSERDLKRYESVEILAPYLKERRREVGDWNKQRNVKAGCPLNGRRLTNLGTFRAYIAAYLKQHPGIHQTGMVFLVRQLEPTEKGIPLEVYVFTNDTRWTVYEGIQADIFDHLIAAASWFGLSLFQAPGGRDIRDAILGSPRLHGPYDPDDAPF